MRKLLTILVGGSLILSAAMTMTAKADPIPFSVYDEYYDIEDDITYDITFDIVFGYTHTDPENATIQLSIVNNATYPGASITGLAFNAPEKVTEVSFLEPPPDDFTVTVAEDINVGPFGEFSLGASNAKNVIQTINGGKPQFGIRVDESGTFSFDLVGTNLDTLNEASFLSLTSVLPSGEEGVSFVVRWQDTDGDGSGFATVIPLPGSLLLCGIGLGFIGVVRRMRRKS